MSKRGKNIDKTIFDPQKYGMVFCLGCNGSGKLLKDDGFQDICLECGGFGFVKREIETFGDQKY